MTPTDRDDPAGGTLDWLLSYADCDPAGILYYATPFVLMERVVSEWSVTRRIDPESLRRDGLALPVVRTTTGDYLATLTVFDRVRCACSVAAVGRTSVRWAGEIRVLGPGGEPAPRPAFTGSMVQVYVDGTGRPVPVPAAVREAGAGASMADLGAGTG